MDLKIFPHNLNGTVFVPPSKSYTHRALIAAALSKGGAVINPLFSDDTKATLECLGKLGFAYSIEPDKIQFKTIKKQPVNKYWAGSSASTLRFLLPVIAQYCSDFAFTGSARLLERIDTEDLSALTGLEITRQKECLKIRGHLSADTFLLSGRRTTQLISGMILALPLLDGARIRLVDIGPDNPYLKMTLAVGRHFGIKYVLSFDEINTMSNTVYRPSVFRVEGDFSHAANWLAAAYLNPELKVSGLNPDSLQGDQDYFKYLKSMGVKYQYNDGSYQFLSGRLSDAYLDISLTPDLGPILISLASVGEGRVIIGGGAKLRYKESDRICVISAAINRLGGRVTVNNDEIIIDGNGMLNGGVSVNGADDHRIVMALTAISRRIRQPYIIKGAMAVNKSYPNFFRDFQNAGGKTVVL
ncbi:MAG: hypothetical protein PHT03_06110 [Bacilli bacterium]|nr:hypothetical protein [Bacilli bacterium]